MPGRNKMGSASVQWNNILLLMSVLIFWVVTICELAGRYQHFGENAISIFRDEVRLLGNGWFIFSRFTIYI
jgi:hypothetical protein